MKLISFVCTYIFILSTAIGQTIEGYSFESGNRGYLRQVKVHLVEKGSDVILQTAFSDEDGYFYMDLPTSGEYILKASKELFEPKEVAVDRSTLNNDKIFVKLKLDRAPGYQFEVTLAPKRISEDIPVDAIKGARIEVYNNTTKEPVMVLDDHPDPEFRLNMTKGNHYTILVRKKGFLAKRMEAYVNVEGCILCFEGIGEVKPGVLDNLTEGNEMGVLLANVSMEPSNEGKKMEINNLYYDLGKATLRRSSERELNKVITLLTDNPTLAIEIGSHTDSRGKTDYNQELSEARAQSVVDFLLDNGDIRRNRLIAKGYGESELRNDCRNGVKCSESAHQKNRRTELKIIGKVAEVRVKSLEEMKKEEEFERSILELDGQEQIKVQNEEELKKVLEEREKGKGPMGESKTSVEGMMKAVDQESQDRLEHNNRKAAADKKKHDEMLALINNNKPIEPSYNAEGKVLNGFVVVIKENGGQPIPISNPFFGQHEHISIYYEDYRNFVYSIGEYASKDEAELVITPDLKSMHPKAYVVEFKEGHIIREK